jgi:site-specific DNA-methyltransferase (adenine-specific)
MVEIDKIFNEDCVSLSKRIESNSIDLIIADPPYNLNKNFGNDSDNWNNVADWLNWSKIWIDECVRILSPKGSIFIYGIHHYLCYIQCYLYEKQLLYNRQFIWHYENGFSGYKKAPSATYEPILWFSKSNIYTYHTIREPYKSTERLRNKITKNGKVWNPHPDGRHAGDVWNIPTLAGKRFAKEKVNHPTQKPLALCDKIIKYFSNVDDLIFVPFVGSGSECVSALINKRRFIGAEINADYIKIAKKRLNNAAVKLII